MEVDFDGYILKDDLPPVPMSAIDYWSDGGEYESDDIDDDYDEDEYDYDKDGRRRWKKKAKNKGDDPSKAIDWKKLFPKFDYDRFNTEQERMTTECAGDNFDGSTDHCPQKRCKNFQELFGRWPGDHRDWVYVRNYADCEYFCQKLLESSVLPGVIGVDIEMENDRYPFRDWDSKWRTIRAHSRLAKGMFARVLQAANCDGLVAVFDLYALAKPHNWDGGIEMNAKYRHWRSPAVPLPTSALPKCLVDFILNPHIIRFGWALHCDWSSLYNSFGLLVPQKSYLDAQTAWIHVLRPEVNGRGNGLADAAAALFGVNLDKSKRGYGHFWHGMPPYGKIPKYMLAYAVRDAQVSLDVALQILVKTNWLKGFDGVWYSANVETIPMPGVRKRVCSWFGIPDEESMPDSGLGSAEDMSASQERSHDGFLRFGKSGIGERSVELMEPGDVVSMKKDETVDEETEEAELDGIEQADEAADPDGSLNDQDAQMEGSDGGDVRIVVSGDRRIVTTKDELTSSPKAKYRWRHGRPRQEDLDWKRLPPPAQEYIKTCRGEAYNVFCQLPRDEKGKNEWSWCPQLAILRSSMRYKLKRLIQGHVSSGNRYKAAEALYLYQKARVLLDNNLESAWRNAFHESDCRKGAKKPTPWGSLQTFQDTLLDKPPIVPNEKREQTRSTVFRSRHQRKNEDRRLRSSEHTTNLLGRIALSALTA